MTIGTAMSMCRQWCLHQYCPWLRMTIRYEKTYFLGITWVPCFWNTFSRPHTHQRSNSNLWVKAKLLGKALVSFLSCSRQTCYLMKTHLSECWTFFPFLGFLLLVVRGVPSPKKIYRIAFLHTDLEAFFRSFFVCFWLHLAN